MLTLHSPRSLGRLCVMLFAISTAFPLAAGLMNTDTPARWLGVLDVTVAASLIAVVFVVTSRHRTKVSDSDRLRAFRVSQVVISVVPILLLGFFIAGNRINWQVLVIGLAWRGWLLLYTLPYLISATRETR